MRSDHAARESDERRDDWVSCCGIAVWIAFLANTVFFHADILSG